MALTALHRLVEAKLARQRLTIGSRKRPLRVPCSNRGLVTASASRGLAAYCGSTTGPLLAKVLTRCRSLSCGFAPSGGNRLCMPRMSQPCSCRPSALSAVNRAAHITPPALGPSRPATSIGAIARARAGRSCGNGASPAAGADCRASASRRTRLRAQVCVAASAPDTQVPVRCRQQSCFLCVHVYLIFQLLQGAKALSAVTESYGKRNTSLPQQYAGICCMFRRCNGAQWCDQCAAGD